MKKLINRLSLSSFQEAIDVSLISTQKLRVIGFVNAHAVNMYLEDEAFADAIMSADVLFRDGIGVSFALRLFGLDPKSNNNGTDLLPRVLEVFKGKTIAIIGTEDRILTDMKELLNSEYSIKNCYTMNGFDFSFEEYLEFLNIREPQMILLAMGMPKQEIFAKYLKEQYENPSLVFNGGAIINFMTGHEKRAPRVLRSIGCEWLWRLIQDPKRLYVRYIYGNSKFLFRVIKFRLLECIN